MDLNDVSDAQLRRAVEAVLKDLREEPVTVRTEQQLEEILWEFQDLAPKLEEARRKLNTLVTDLLIQRGLKVHETSSRAKGESSLRKKLRNTKYLKLSDIKDLIGLRIVTYFESEVAAVAELIESEFTPDWNHSYDRRSSTDDSTFGYRSVHYVCRLSDKRANLAEYGLLANVFFEVQIRSILQHAWAEMEHDLGYKSNAAVPRGIRRRFARVASALEGLDEDFNFIKDFLKSETERVGETDDLVPLDLASIQAFTCSDVEVNRIDLRIAALSSGGTMLKVKNLDFYKGILKGLDMLEIRNLIQVKKILKAYEEIPNMLDFAAGLNKKEYTRHGWCLFSVILLLLLGKDGLHIEKIDSLKSFMGAVSGSDCIPVDWQVLGERGAIIPDRD